MFFLITSHLSMTIGGSAFRLCRSDPLWSLRESDSQIHRPRHPARAAGSAARPDADPPLVLAPADRGPVRVDRPRRLAGLGRRSDRDAERPAFGPDRRAHGRRVFQPPALRGWAAALLLI